MVRTLKANNKGQIFISTHSRDVLVELQADNLFLVKRKAKALKRFDNSLQGCLRRNPETFYADRVIVCEGATEIGICRALDNYRISNGKENVSCKGVRFADGSGSSSASYCEGFRRSDYDVCLFCDSDVKKRNDVNQKKDTLKKLGVHIIDWDEGDSIEDAIFKNLPATLVEKALNLAVELRLKDDSSRDSDEIKKSIIEGIESKFGSTFPKMLSEENCNQQLKKAIGEAAKAGAWFKSVEKGQALGRLIFDNYTTLQEANPLRKQFDNLSNWINNG